MKFIFYFRIIDLYIDSEVTISQSHGSVSMGYLVYLYGDLRPSTAFVQQITNLCAVLWSE